MKDIKQEVDKFLETFKNVDEIERLRKAITIENSQEGLRDLEIIKEAELLLIKWFKRKVYSLGRIINKLEILFTEKDYNHEICIGYSVEAKKDKINIGRYLLNLILIIESKDREIVNLQKEVQAEKQNYLEMENIISDLINEEKTSEEIKKECNQFYWLRNRNEE